MNQQPEENEQYCQICGAFAPNGISEGLCGECYDRWIDVNLICDVCGATRTEVEIINDYCDNCFKTGLCRECGVNPKTDDGLCSVCHAEQQAWNAKD